MKLVHPQIEPWLIRTDSGGRVQLWLSGGVPEQVWLRTELDNEELLLPMQPQPDQHGWQRFSADFCWDSGNSNLHYCFKVIADGQQYWLSAQGHSHFYPPRATMFKLSADQRPPDWVRQQVFYQIFPDRFCQGAPELARRPSDLLYGNRWPVITQAWGEPVGTDQPARYFFGGDLPGIERQLDYLQQLGITALYLNPIFKSGSNHKYDTEDYYQVDPHLGGNSALLSLSQALKQRGLRLILDAVINHTSFNHPWFNRFGLHPETGAYQSETSVWRDWYSFLPGGHYVGWKTHASLPVLNLAVLPVQQQLYLDEDSVLHHWLNPPYSIDGWRFDVAHMLGDGSGSLNNHRHFVAIRESVKARYPDAYLFGEHFFEATDWLQGNEQDGAMNYYGFALPVRAWLAGLDVAYQPNRISTQDFARWLQQARQLVPFDNQLAQFNLLDSHDTHRFFSLIGADLGRMRLAVLLLMTYPGVPCVYYGDEIGLEGGADPDCRRCFDWEPSHWLQPLWQHYQQSIGLRKARPELQSGAYQLLRADGDLLVFARYLAEQACIVAVQRSLQPVRFEIDWSLLPLPALSWTSDQGVLLRGAQPEFELNEHGFGWWLGERR